MPKQQMYCWFCEIPVRAHVKGSPEPLKPEQYAYFRRLYNKVETQTKPGSRDKRQAQRCLRKEYRILTDEEMIRFHNAVNALKNDTSEDPNRYDALALHHTGAAILTAHGGPGFAGWHAFYLMLFEAALQQVDPSVCLPYWDSTIDSALEDPTESYVWSDDFFGSQKGEVTRGPFAGWMTPDGIGLIRSVGHGGQLFTRAGIEAIMSCNTYEEILMPDKGPQYNLEFLQSRVHEFVGGHMGRLETAAYDVVFFLHHAFVDYIFDMFREKIRNNGLDPERYPSGKMNDFHVATAATSFGFTQEECYLESMRESYEYQPSPQCSHHSRDCGGSRYLWCNMEAARCEPIDPNHPPHPRLVPMPAPTPTPMPGPIPKPKLCSSPRCQAHQNSFLICMPMKIVAWRPPEFHDYASYPVINGKISKTSDIYEPSAYNDTNSYIKPKVVKPKQYEECNIKDGVGKILMSSMGVNYDGSYKESFIMDQHLAASVGVTCITAKDPGPKDVTEVILRAHDQCGRICHIACQIPGSSPPCYESCSGVMEVTSQPPLQYGTMYAKATLDVYDYASNADCPSFVTNDFFMTFYCDYRDHLPWVDKVQNPVTGPQGPRPSPVVRPSNSRQCRLSSQCTVNQKCFKDGPQNTSPRQCHKYMEMHECVDNCGHYAVCIYGIYWLRSCLSGMHFDEFKGHCVRGPCRNRPHHSGPGGRFLPLSVGMDRPGRVPARSSGSFGSMGTTVT